MAAKNEYQKAIAKRMGIRPVAYNPGLSAILGSVKAGLFLSQLLFWWGKGRYPGWIYKTIYEIRRETFLSRKEQETAVKICIKLGVIEKRIFGIPGKRYFKINVDQIYALIEKYHNEHSPPAP